MANSVVDFIEKATLDVFSLMIGVEVLREPDPSAWTQHKAENREVNSRFTLNGAVSGTASVGYSLELARAIATKMLGVEGVCPDEDVVDAAGEVANMIIGNVKNEIAGPIGVIQIGTPTVQILPHSSVDPKAAKDMVWFRCMDAVFCVAIEFSKVTEPAMV